MTPEWFAMVAHSALANGPTVEATYDIAMQALTRHVPGDFVECGVYAGAQSAMMARALLDFGIIDGRRVHLFDSFEGIPAAGPEDSELAGKPAGISACSLSAVKANMDRWGIPESLLVYHPGWFADTVPSAGIAQIAVLRLDGDLYRSTKVCFDNLYPRVSRGGWVIADDYHLSGCRKAINETCYPAPVYWRVPTN